LLEVADELLGPISTLERQGDEWIILKKSFIVEEISVKKTSSSTSQ
jgi:hypothetical protein